MKTQNKQNSTKQLPLLRRGLGRGFVTLTILLFTFNSYSQGSGHALGFDGGTDYIDCGNQTSINRADKSFTISSWIKVNSYSSGFNSWVEAIVSNRSSGNNIGSLFFVRGSSDPSNFKKIAFDVNSTLTGTRILFGNTLIETGKWYHVAVTFQYNIGANNNICTLYVNGNVDGSDGTMANIVEPTPVKNTIIGYENSTAPSTYHFNGQIDEVRIWSRALTQTEIQTNMCKKLTGTEPGLVAYYPMNEGIDNTCSGGEDVCDMSGNGNNGTKY